MFYPDYQDSGSPARRCSRCSEASVREPMARPRGGVPLDPEPAAGSLPGDGHEAVDLRQPPRPRSGHSTRQAADSRRDRGARCTPARRGPRSGTDRDARCSRCASRRAPRWCRWDCAPSRPPPTRATMRAPRVVLPAPRPPVSPTTTAPPARHGPGIACSARPSACPARSVAPASGRGIAPSGAAGRASLIGRGAGARGAALVHVVRPESAKDT